MPSTISSTPEEPLYLSIEEQCEQSLSIHCLAVTLAARRAGCHLDTLPLAARVYDEHAATIAWLWRDPVMRRLARQCAEQDAMDEQRAASLHISQAEAANLARIAIDAYERVLIGLEPITAARYHTVSDTMRA